MKTRQSTGYIQQVNLILLLCIISSFVFSGTALALTGNDINQCYDCHGSPVVPGPADIRPLDYGYRNITTGAFVGNHRTHIASATTATNVCATCHGPSPSTMNHRDGRIYLNNGNIKNGSYSKGPFFNQTSAPVLGSCSSVNCHFNNLTPNWGATPAWSSTKTANDGNINCAQCHSATTLATGTHAKHIAAGGGTQVACRSCHPDYNALAGTAAFQHATSAARPINVNFSAAPNLGGSYAGGRTSSQLFQAVPPAASGTCSNTYCHTNGTLSSGYTSTVTWGNTLAPCAGCHASAATLSTGSHSAHLAVANVTCTYCHNATASNNTTISNVANHVDKNVTINFNATAAPAGGAYNAQTAGGATVYQKPVGTAAGRCSNVSCHADVYSAGTVSTPTWGVVSDCSACHSIAIAASGPATGSHVAHGAFTCIQCHNAGTTSTTSPTTQHGDGNIDVLVGYPASVTKHASGTYSGTCSASACHGASSPVWGTNLTTRDTCTKCHGTLTNTGIISAAANNRYLVAPPTAITGATGTLTGTGQVSNNTKVGAHQAHLRYLNGFSNYSTVDFMCANCHGTLPVSGSHANGTSSPAFQGLANNRGAMTPTWSAATFSCSNTYCHNPAGTGGKLTAANVGIRPFVSWTASSYLDIASTKTQANCNRCHKVPEDAGFTSTYNHNSMATTTSCTPCHAHEGNTAGAAGRRHMDGIVFGQGNCDACHGYQTGTWAAAAERSGVPEGKGAHEKHIAYLTARYSVTLTPATDQFGSAAASWTNVCGVCHNGATHNTGEALPGTGRTISIQPAYWFGPGTGTPVYSGIVGTSSATTAKTCSNVSCHYFASPLWSTY